MEKRYDTAHAGSFVNGVCHRFGSGASARNVREQGDRKKRPRARGSCANVFILRNASVKPARPRPSDRMESRLEAQRRTASWRSAGENKVNAPAFLPIGGTEMRATQGRPGSPAKTFP